MKTSDNIDKEIQKLEKKLEKKRLELKEQKERCCPPAKILEKMINEFKTLDQGQSFDKYYPALDCMINFTIFWEEGIEATMEINRLYAKKNASTSKKRLIEMVNEYEAYEHDHDLRDEICGTIMNSKEYCTFQKRIDKLVAKSDELERQYPDTYCWEKDILD